MSGSISLVEDPSSSSSSVRILRPTSAQSEEDVYRQRIKEQEEELESQQTNHNLIVCCVILFVAEASRGLFIPSLWPTVQHVGRDRDFMSWCIPTFSFGRMIGSYLMGWWADKINRDGPPCIFSLCCETVGALLFAFADIERSWKFLLVAQFLMGLGGGTLAVLRAHVGKITTDKDRLTHMTYISIAQFVGLGMMPMVALIMYHMVIAAMPSSALESVQSGKVIDEHVALELAMAGITAAADTMLSHHMSFSYKPSSNTPQTDQLAHQEAMVGQRSTTRLQHHRPGRIHLHDTHASNQDRWDVALPHESMIDSHRTTPSSSHQRHLLSSASSVATVATVAMTHTLSETSNLPLAQTGFNSPTFSVWHIINHRTSPALLLAVLNTLCLALTFVFFDEYHQSSEYKEKKKEEEEKKRRKQRREMGLDEEESESAFSDLQKSRSSESKQDNAPQAVQSHTFDLSKLNQVLPTLAQTNATDNNNHTAKANTTTKKGNKAHKSTEADDEDTTVIVLEPSTLTSSLASSSSLSADYSSFSSSPRSSRSSSPTGSKGKSVVIAEDRNEVRLIGLEQEHHSEEENADEDEDEDGTHETDSIALGNKASNQNKGKKNKKSTATTTAAAAATASTSGPIGIVARVRHIFQDLVSLHHSSANNSTEKGRQRSGVGDEAGVSIGGFHITEETLVTLGACLFVFINFTIRGVLAVIETVGTPELARYKGIEKKGDAKIVEASATFFGFLGLLGCGVFWILLKLQHLLSEPIILIAGFVVVMFGTFVIVVLSSEFFFYVGCVCIWSFGLPAIQNTVLSALSRILGAKPQGTWMGWIQLFGSLGRVTFPFITKVASINFAFALSSALCATAISLLLAYMKLVQICH